MSKKDNRAFVHLNLRNATPRRNHQSTFHYDTTTAMPRNVACLPQCGFSRHLHLHLHLHLPRLNRPICRRIQWACNIKIYTPLLTRQFCSIWWTLTRTPTTTSSRRKLTRNYRNNRLTPCPRNLSAHNPRRFTQCTQPLL